MSIFSIACSKDSGIRAFGLFFRHFILCGLRSANGADPNSISGSLLLCCLLGFIHCSFSVDGQSLPAKTFFLFTRCFSPASRHCRSLSGPFFLSHSPLSP